ncbi:carbohydrate-binding module family 50 protein, partial [Piedraia hortae CBS 480.64]
SRRASPIPASHPSRPSTSPSQPSSRGNGVGKTQVPGGASGLWSHSWSSLQGMAFELLSGETAKEGPTVARGPLDGFFGPRSVNRKSQAQWGPQTPAATSATGEIGTGTNEERIAAVRMQKRKDMMMQDQSSYADTLGKFKRRLSDAHSISAPPGEGESRETLVYLHHVDQSDTLAGIAIKYNCSSNMIRKANRMWPNDTAQARRVLVLPVDACQVKGRPVTDATAVDLLTTDSDALEPAEDVGDGTVTRGRSAQRYGAEAPSSLYGLQRTTSSVESGPRWTHDSWVLLPGSNRPTEIARLSRRTLAYFPPARRKSLGSEQGTPSSSLDCTRSAVDSTASSPAGDLQPRSRRHQRKRSSASNGYFPSYLAGPGGVGTLDGNVNHPGPAQDPLNQFFAKHLPDVAPPKSQLGWLMPEMPFSADSPIISRPSTPGNGPLNINVGQVGGAIESWVRRIAMQTKEAVSPLERPSRSAPDSSIGDLIEMTDELDV